MLAMTTCVCPDPVLVSTIAQINVDPRSPAALQDVTLDGRQAPGEPGAW